MTKMQQNHTSHIFMRLRIHEQLTYEPSRLRNVTCHLQKCAFLSALTLQWRVSMSGIEDALIALGENHHNNNIRSYFHCFNA